MNFDFFKKTEKLLGVENRKRRYDLPLDKTEGTGFLKILILMMTLLAVMAFSVFFVLSELTQRWTSGLENKATVEIPAHDADGNVIPNDEIAQLSQRAQAALRSTPSVESVRVMSEEEIQELVSPWLGENTNLNDIPLPGLIAITFTEKTPEGVATMKRELEAISPIIRLDTHQSWLMDVLRITGSMKFGAALLLAVTGIITVSAVAGAVKSRIAVHKDEVELLHLIGATDHYITNQFQKHTALMSLQSGFIGLIVGLIGIFIIAKIAGQNDISVLPDFSLSTMHYFILCLLPILMSALGLLTARITVLHALRRMP